MGKLYIKVIDGVPSSEGAVARPKEKHVSFPTPLPPDEELIKHGWYPFENNPPAITDAQKREPGGFDVQPDKVVVRYKITDLPADEVRDFKRRSEYPTIDELIVALWEKEVEGRPEAADALQAKRLIVKVKYPKSE